MNKDSILHGLLITAIVAIVGTAGFIAWKQLYPEQIPPGPQSQVAGLTTFTSPQDFRTYLDSSAGLGPTSGIFPSSRDSLILENVGTPTLGLGTTDEKASPSPNRVSQTNVQVSGIDEPDIVKTDGANIFVSSEQQFFYNLEEIIPLKGETLPADSSDPVSIPSDTGSGTTSVAPSPTIIRPEPIQATTKVVRAQPPEAPTSSSTIPVSGNLLLDKNMLIVFSNQLISAYDVSKPAEPAKRWTATLPDNTGLTTARLHLGKIYVVTQTYINRVKPCPLPALQIDDLEITMPCTEIYHPTVPTSVDTTYTAMIMNPQTGQVEKKVSFLGSAGTSVVYMSEQALYITYSVYADPVVTQYDFLTTAVNDLLPTDVREKIQRLQNYEISRQAKLVELETIMTAWQNSLTLEEQERIQKTMSERQRQYQRQHLRSFETTNVVKVELSNLAVAGTGAVPGQVLNQFAMDEHGGNLRIATTISGGFFGGGETANDVYILGPDLKARGNILDLAPGERIYSARFVGDTGYLVTFKQIDPFFVLDLKDPHQPRVAGELKIPGFSSYLHPLSATLVLGVGQEESKTKLSLFDVSNPSQPVEKSKLLLGWGWTEIQTNHHAFLQDDKHKIVFIPAGNSGEIISYDQGTLVTKKTISDIRARRAVYINDFLYVISDEKMVVLNERTWEQVSELIF